MASHLRAIDGWLASRRLAEQEGAPRGEPGTRTAPCCTGGLRAFAHTTRHDTLPGLFKSLRCILLDRSIDALEERCAAGRIEHSKLILLLGSWRRVRCSGI
jgi:hypothetical protein